MQPDIADEEGNGSVIIEDGPTKGLPRFVEEIY